MIIDQLPEVSAVQETDEIPVERGTTTYKSTLQKLKDLVASLLTKADIGLGNVANKDLSNVDNVQQYSAQNPPPYPVTSVNGQTGAVELETVSEIISGTQSFLISANAAAAIYPFTINVPDGYTFVCPAAWLVGNYNLHVYGVIRKSSTEISIYAENALSSDVGCQVTLIFAR